MGIFRRERKSASGNVSVIETDGDMRRAISAVLGDSFDASANPYVYRCADLKATVCASIRPIAVDEDGNEAEVPELRSLFRHPNPLHSWRDMVYDAVMDLSITGNGYIIPITADIPGGRVVSELWQIGSENVTPHETSNLFLPVDYWMVGAGTGERRTVLPEDMVHIHTRLNQQGTEGMDPLRPIRQSIEQQAVARMWNLALMRNGSKPTLVISDQKTMTEGQFEEFKRRFRSSYEGASAAGRAIVLDGGKTATGIGFSALDMDFANSMTVCAREIAIGMGVPPELIGDSANKTYSNAVEANREFAEHTVEPILAQLYGQLTRAIVPKLPREYRRIRISYDQAQVDELKGGRDSLMGVLAACDYLSVNDKRGMLNFPPVEGGDVVMVQAGAVPIDEASAPISDLMASVRSEPA